MQIAVKKEGDGGVSQYKLDEQKKQRSGAKPAPSVSRPREVRHSECTSVKKKRLSNVKLFLRVENLSKTRCIN